MKTNGILVPGLIFFVYLCKNKLFKLFENCLARFIAKS